MQVNSVYCTEWNRAWKTSVFLRTNILDDDVSALLHNPLLPYEQCTMRQLYSLSLCISRISSSHTSVILYLNSSPLFPFLLLHQSLQRLLNKKNEEGDLDCEEESRSLMILQLQSYCTDSLDELDLIKQARARARSHGLHPGSGSAFTLQMISSTLLCFVRGSL